MMDQRLDRLDGLHGCIRQPAMLLIERCTLKLNRKLLIVQGWRSLQEQMLIYQKGRTLNRDTNEWEITGDIVTKAKPGLSAHNVISKQGERASMALDVIPLLPDGTAEWNVDDNFWDKLYELAWKVGLDPLGDVIGSYLAGDKGHFEEPAWKLKLDGLGLIQPVTT
jgi:hypothetical protein